MYYVRERLSILSAWVPVACEPMSPARSRGQRTHVSFESIRAKGTLSTEQTGNTAVNLANGLHQSKHTHWSEMIAILRIEGRISLQPSVALRDDDFFVWVRWQRLYLVIIRGYVKVRRWVTRTGKRGSPRTLSPGRAISLLTSSLPCSCGDLFTHAAWHGLSLASSTRMYGRRAHRISTRVLGEGRTSRIMKKKLPERNDVPAFISPFYHDGPATEECDVPRA